MGLGLTVKLFDFVISRVIIQLLDAILNPAASPFSLVIK